jgi:anaerobic magnesium-protoporphyrin IX monomethyl ester cyclase
VPNATGTSRLRKDRGPGAGEKGLRKQRGPRPGTKRYEWREIGIILLSVKVLLVQPPVEDFYDTSIRTYPLALLYLGRRIRDIAEVTVLDLRSKRKPKRLGEHPFPDLRPYYRERIRTPFSFFGAYYRFGADEEEIREALGKARADVVAISSLFTTYSMEALDVARLAKEVNPEVTTVLGGIHPTLFPVRVLESPTVDYVIRGEGETPLFDLVRALDSGGMDRAGPIGGLCRRDKEGFHITEPHVEAHIDEAPDRRLIDPDAYRIGRKNYTFFLTSRGCPLHCAFCGRPSVPYRKRSLESMEREIADCLDIGIGAVDFEDDMLNLDARHFGATLDLFRGTSLTLSAMNGIYSEKLDPSALGRMYDAGFRRLNFSLVDISRPVMERQKRLFPSNFLALLPHLEASPFLVETHFIIGLPGQTADEILDTMIFLMGRRLLPGPSIFYLAPGSPIFDERAGEDRGRSVKSLRGSAMFPINPLLPRETLFTFMKLTRFINFVKAALDREPGARTLWDLAEAPALVKDPVDREIIAVLLREKRFMCYDLHTLSLLPEPQDDGLVKLFFRRAEGLHVRGFKTMNSVIIG